MIVIALEAVSVDLALSRLLKAEKGLDDGYIKYQR